MENGRIFIVEDDLISAQYLKEILEHQGYTVLGIADNAEEAIEQLYRCPVDIVLMDILLKGALSGTEAAVILKQRYPKCRVVFLTAYADDEMIEYAVEAKASAYLMKPYREREIVATIQMILAQDTPAPSTLRHSEILLPEEFVYDTDTRLLSRHGTVIHLSARKRTLIELLATHRNTVVSNAELCMAIWGSPQHDSNLRSLISRLKESLDANIITNINGMGYMIADPGSYSHYHSDH